LEKWEGCELGVWALTRPVSHLSDPVIQSSRTFGEGHGGGGWTLKFMTMGESASQAVRYYMRRRGVTSGDGEASSMVLGMWSEQFEGRDVSHPLTQHRSRGFAKAKLITERRAFPERGNMVYMPWELWSAKPPSAAISKYGAEEETC